MALKRKKITSAPPDSGYSDESSQSSDSLMLAPEAMPEPVLNGEQPPDIDTTDDSQESRTVIELGPPEPIEPLIDRAVLDAFAPYRPAQVPAQPDQTELEASPAGGALSWASPDTGDECQEETEDDTAYDASTLSYEEPDLPAIATGLAADDPLLERISASLVKSPRSSRLIARLGQLSATFEIASDTTIVGRSDLTANLHPDVAIDWDDAVSRQHAQVLHTDDGDWLEDLSSTNGTRINGIKLTPNDPVKLNNGDLIKIGSVTELIYEKSG